MKNNSILTYQKYLFMCYKYGLYKLQKKTFTEELNKKIDFDLLFENMSDKNNFTIQNHVNDYILENIYSKYTDNYFFQYSIFLLSNYVFENKQKFLQLIKKTYHNLVSLKINDISKTLKKLKKINNFKDDDLTSFTKIANEFFSNKKVDTFIENKYNCLEILNDLRTDNYLYGQEYEVGFLKALILLKNNVNIKRILKETKDSNDILKYAFNTLKLNLNIKNESKNNKLKLLNYLNKVYIKEGYFFHGTNSYSLKKIKKHGLNSQFNDDKANDYTIKINDIFEKYHVYKMFEAKPHKKLFLRFFVTDDPTCAVYYANQSPEYFSRFCANSPNYSRYQSYDINAFFKRDYKACKKNINDFMKSINFNNKDIKIVNKYFKLLWKLNVKKNQYPLILVGKKSLINRDSTKKYNIIKDNLNKFFLKDIFDYIISPDNIHDIKLSKIDFRSLSIIKLPNLYSFFKIKNSLSKKYIIYNNKKIYPDLVIDAKYQNKLYIVITKNKKILFNNDVLFIPNNIDLLKKELKDNFFKERIDLLLTDNAIFLTRKGSNLLRKLKNKFSLDYLLKYYKTKINNIFKNNGVFDVNTTLTLIDNFYIKYIISKKYHLYFSDALYGIVNVEHYKIDNSNSLTKYKSTKMIDKNKINNMINKVKKQMDIKR